MPPKKKKAKAKKVAADNPPDPSVVKALSNVEGSVMDATPRAEVV